jgi:non-specific serine/threonine protein kinase
MAERAEPGITGPRAAEWYARLEREHDNLRAALGWMRARGDVDSALRLGNALGRFWYKRGYLGEGRSWLESLLSMVTPDWEASNGLLTLRAKVQNWAGWLALMQGDVGSATAHLESSLTLARQARDVRTEAAILNDMGTLAQIQGDLVLAAARHADSLELARRVDDPRARAVAQDNLSFIACFRGDLRTAETLLAEAMEQARHLGDWVLVSQHLSWAGSIARRQGDGTRAWALQRDALAMQWELGVPMLAAETLQHLAATAGASGRGEQAARLFGAGAAQFEEHSLVVHQAWRVDADEVVAAARTALGEEAWQSSYEAGRALSLDEAIAEVLGGT